MLLYFVGLGANILLLAALRFRFYTLIRTIMILYVAEEGVCLSDIIVDAVDSFPFGTYGFQLLRSIEQVKVLRGPVF